MDRRTALPLAEQIAAAQAWWREAGVDLAFSDEPQGWLAEPEEEEAPVRPTVSAEALPVEPERSRIGGDPAGWPQDLDGFHRWWLEEPSLDRGGMRPRIAPRGPQGRLVASMLQAMGFDPEAVYIAAALPRYEVVPDWAALGRDGLGEVLRHHLALAAPERLIVLGRDVSPLLRHDWTQPAPAVDEISIQARKLPVMTSFSPARLLEQPGLRKRLWQQWLEWSERDMG